MGKNSKISWVDNTFNMVWGCTKTSTGCEKCYAETLARRFGWDVFGDNKPRREMSARYWGKPFQWNAEAEKNKQKQTVFAGSMCDIFEINPDQEVNDFLNKSRLGLWKLIQKTPHLIWLLLTKRPENIHQLSPREWVYGGFPKNVWLGITIEDQDAMARLIPLEKLKAKKFVSFEPLVGKIELEQVSKIAHATDWGIIGGESGSNRMMDVETVRDIIGIYKTCRCVPVFFKQAGDVLAKEWGCSDKKGQILEEWPSEFQIQEFPEW